MPETDLQKKINGNVGACLLLLLLLLMGVAADVFTTDRLERKIDLICEAVECEAQTEGER